MYNGTGSLLVVLLLAFLSACGEKPDVHSIHTSQNDQDKALSALTSATEANPDDPQVFLTRAEYYVSHDLYSKAISDFIRCTELESTNSVCWQGLAQAYLDDNRSRQAVESLEDFLKISPNHIPARFQLAEYQTIIERFQAAHFNLDAILDKAPNHAEALLLKGLVYKYQNKPLQAVEFMQQAIQSDPDLTDGHLMLGQLFEEAKNSLALKYYENAVRVDPSNEEAKMAIANYHWMRNNYEQALGVYEQLLEQHKDFAKGYFNQGLIFLELDSFTRATTAFNEALVHDNNFVLAHYYLGEAHYLSENWQKAKESFERASQLAPSDERAKEKLRDIEQRMANN